MSIGSRIAAMRGYRRLNQETLGGLVGVSKQTISNWEHDYRKPDAQDIHLLESRCVKECQLVPLAAVL